MYRYLQKCLYRGLCPKLSTNGIGVALFLILSGYGLTESYKRKGLLVFWKSKFSKIWIPYAIVLTVCTIWSLSFKPYVIVQYCLIDSPFGI